MDGDYDTKQIVAIVCLHPDRVLPGGVPVLIAQDRKEQQEVAWVIGRIMDAMTHDLGNGCLLVVRH
ncbi:MAG: hypothetical protein WD535_00155 [Thermaerobacterales bacterium]